MISIIVIGKKHESWIQDGVERYSRRLNGLWKVIWVFLPHSSRERLEARQNESERILNKLSPKDYVILLDERGVSYDSPAFSKQLIRTFESSKNIVFVIGGAYGVTDELIRRADIVWSLSPLVFPHQLVRLMLIEQIYRAEQIGSGTPYHHS